MSLPPSPPPGWSLAASEATPAAPPPRRRGPWIAILASLAVIATALVVVAPWDAQRRQAIEDQLTVWSNPPSAQIERIAEATTLTETGRRIFFASLPVVEDAASFNEHCALEGSTVLGCYDGERIYVYRVTDERLEGTIEVTSAHEFLHAVYARLSRDERRRVDGLVAAAASGIPEDDPIHEIMATYPERQLADEWHARLGTEFAEIGPELEEHYAEYFADRGVIVALNEHATAALRGLESEIDGLVAEIDALAADLEERGERYDRLLGELNADIDDFNARADTPGSFASQSQFDAERAELLARSDELERDRLALNEDTDRYNALVAELEELDARYTDLYSELDSTQAPGAVEE